MYFECHHRHTFWMLCNLVSLYFGPNARFRFISIFYVVHVLSCLIGAILLLFYSAVVSTMLDWKCLAKDNIIIMHYTSAHCTQRYACCTFVVCIAAHIQQLCRGLYTSYHSINLTHFQIVHFVIGSLSNLPTKLIGKSRNQMKFGCVFYFLEQIIGIGYTHIH